MSSALDDVSTLSALFAASGLASLELRGPSGRVLLARDASAAPSSESPTQAGVEAERGEVASPGVGTLRLTHPLHERPLADEGDEVAAGQPLALVEVGPLLRPVLSPCAGTVTAIHRAEGDLVGFGDPLFDLLP